MRNTWSLVALTLAVATVGSAQDYPRVETFFGYTYTRANSASNVPAFSANGGSGQLALNFNRWGGFVMDVGAVHNGNISGYPLDSTFTNYLFGPRISLRHSRVTPYFNVLFGGVHAGTSIGVAAVPVATPVAGVTAPPPGQPVTLRATAAQTAFGMTAGGGIDIKMSRHVSFRPIGLEYYMTRFQNFRSAEDNNQHNIRYTAGLNFTFGGEAPAPPPPPPPPPPAMRTCRDGSQVPLGAECPKLSMDLKPPGGVELCPGATLNLTAPGPTPAGASYQWTLNGQPLGSQQTIEFGSTGREPGTYKLGLTVTAPDYNDATLERNVTIGTYAPPSGTVEATPREVWAGEKVALAARFNSGSCGGTLGAPVFAASEGSISGSQFDTAQVQFDPGSTSEQRKTITVTARVADEKGQGTAQTAFVVKKAAATMPKRLPDIIFPVSSARVNNCGKRVLLEELKAMTDSDPNGSVVFVGHVSAKEAGKAGLDQQRALNAAAVISAGQGICYGFSASKILVGGAGAADNGVDYQSHFCGTTGELPGSIVKESESDAKFRRVEVWFVPSNGAPPATAKDYKDAASLSVSHLGCPK